MAALAALVGAVLAIVASWVVVVFVFELPFDLPWVDLLLFAAGTFLVTALFGGFAGGTGTSRSPQETLRQDSI